MQQTGFRAKSKLCSQFSPAAGEFPAGDKRLLLTQNTSRQAGDCSFLQDSVPSRASKPQSGMCPQVPLFVQELCILTPALLGTRPCLNAPHLNPMFCCSNDDRSMNLPTEALRGKVKPNKAQQCRPRCTEDTHSPQALVFLGTTRAPEATARAKPLACTSQLSFTGLARPVIKYLSGSP